MTRWYHRANPIPCQWKLLYRIDLHWNLTCLWRGYTSGVGLIFQPIYTSESSQPVAHSERFALCFVCFLFFVIYSQQHSGQRCFFLLLLVGSFSFARRCQDAQPLTKLTVCISDTDLRTGNKDRRSAKKNVKEIKSEWDSTFER